jgi:AcrR family transcriptional regulator
MMDTDTTAMEQTDKKTLIMGVAEKLFSTRRFHEITTDEIARQAGVGKGTIYRYFLDKDDLFFQTAMTGFDELCDLLQNTLPAEADFAAQLLSACHQIHLFFHRRRQLTQMMHADADGAYWNRPDISQRWLAQRHKLVRAVAVVIDKGIAEGVLRSDVQPEILANFLLGLLRTRFRDLGDIPEEKKSMELIVGIFCHGACGPK